MLYKTILRPLGYKDVYRDQDAYGFGISYWQFGIYPGERNIVSLHVAFKASIRKCVDRFHELAIEQGVQSNGLPGLRKYYGADYYAAYILDFDGHNIEAVCRLK